jgi:hypothetical protein
MITWLRYVPHHLVASFEAIGWVLDDDLRGTSHGEYAVLMRWAGDGEPR